MVDRIFNGRFYNNSRTPAWHGLGVNLELEASAEQAYELAGTYEVSKQPLFIGDGANSIETEYSIIVREPVTDDPIRRIFGKPVHKGYELIDAAEAAAIWDRSMGNVGGKVASPTETFGVLGKGEEVFITTKARTFDVNGDEIDVFEFLYSPMFSGKAAVAGITPIRIVCANTLMLGMKKAVQQFMVTHTKGARGRLEKQLREQHEDNLAMMDTAKQVMTALADRKVKSEAEAKMLIGWTYPDPAEPQTSWTLYSGLTMEEHQAKYEEKVKKVDMIREQVFGLFSGAGRGMLESGATNGTFFGIWNAVSEYETYRIGSRERTAVGLVAGERGATIANASRILMDYASK